jgi:hypothetical protein
MHSQSILVIAGASQTMPRFYFHLSNHTETPDREGLELPDVDTAEQQAIDEARALIGADVRQHGRITLTHRIIIADEAGNVVRTVSYADAITVEN